MVGVVVALVDGVLFPVFDVDVAQAAHEQLQLVLIEDLQQRQRHDLVEALQDGVHLRLYTGHEPPLDDEPVMGGRAVSGLSGGTSGDSLTGRCQGILWRAVRDSLTNYGEQEDGRVGRAVR